MRQGPIGLPKLYPKNYFLVTRSVETVSPAVTVTR